MRNTMKSVVLQMDGNIVEYPVIFTFACCGIRVPGDSTFVRKLLEPKTDELSEVLPADLGCLVGYAPSSRLVVFIRHMVAVGLHFEG